MVCSKEKQQIFQTTKQIVMETNYDNASLLYISKATNKYISQNKGWPITVNKRFAQYAKLFS